jgi:hypothetical protein
MGQEERNAGTLGNQECKTPVPTTEIDATAKTHPSIPLMVRYLTPNGKSNGYRVPLPFALRYRRAKGDDLSVVGQPPFHHYVIPSFLFTLLRHR